MEGSRFAIRLACQLSAVIGGAAIFAPLFGYLGSTADRAMLGIDAMGSRTIIGIGAGAIIGAILVAMLLALNIAGPGGLGLATILGIYVVYRVLRFQWVSAETGPKNADGSRNQRMPARQRQRSG